MTAQAPNPLGFGLSCTYCTAVLPFPDGTTRAVTCIQPPLGLGTDPASGALLPSSISGRPLLREAVLRRLSTPRGTLPDTKIPTTVGQYGIDILDYVNADMTPADIGRLSASVDAQARADERCRSSSTSAVLVGDSTLVTTISLVDGTGPFKLTLAINALTQNLQVLS